MFKSGRAAATAEHARQTHQSRSAGSRHRRVGQRVVEATSGLGCTGGQHRSVFLVESLHKRFSGDWVSLKRHRELDL
jgi:RNase adaptor protein for sRNA GlmZ degradation